MLNIHGRRNGGPQGPGLPKKIYKLMKRIINQVLSVFSTF